MKMSFVWKAAAVVLLLLVPQLPFGSSYPVYMLNLILIYCMAALGLQLLIGISGQISLGHAAFMAIGSYTSALLTAKLHLPFLVGLLAAALLTALIGFALGLPALRLHGPYLALATISFGTALPELLAKWEPLTGGHAGMLVPTASIGPLVLGNEYSLYYLNLGVLIFLFWFSMNLLRSRFGRAWQSLRESEIAAQSMGVNLAFAKTSAFALSAAYGGIAGSLYAHLVGFISPIDFNSFMSLQLLAMLVVGGLGSLPGSIVGATTVNLLLAFLSRTRGWSLIIEGILVIVTVWFLPTGLVGIGQLFTQWQARRGTRASARQLATAAAAEGVSRHGSARG